MGGEAVTKLAERLGEPGDFIGAGGWQRGRQALGADLIINTSCEHIADLRGWLALLPRGARVMLQSNDYFSEPTPAFGAPFDRFAR